MTDSTDFLRRQLYTLRQTARYLLEKAADAGGEVRLDPKDRHSLDDTRNDIAACKSGLRAQGVLVDDLPEDVSPPAVTPDAQGRPAATQPVAPHVAPANSDSSGNQGVQGVFQGPVGVYNTNTPAGHPEPSNVFQLRAPVPDFLGRDAELERLVTALRPGKGGRVVAICGVRGMGGLGKTELAYAAAVQLTAHYPNGQILLELAGASSTPLSSAEALQQVIRAFRPEDTLPEEVPALQPIYRSTLAGRKVLILADDARDVAQVRPLLPPPGCALLVTSRQRFILDGMIPLNLERLEEGAAVVLLRGICARLTEEHARQIARLCDYLPLALRISAGILLNNAALSVEQYLNQLTVQRLAALRDPDDLARDVEAILLLSYATLDERMQAHFRRLGAMNTRIYSKQFAAVLELSEDETNEVLHKLLRRSLIDYNEENKFWEIHDLVRTCANKLLIEAGEQRVIKIALEVNMSSFSRRSARMRHASFYINLIKQADSSYQAGYEGVLTGLSLFDRESGNLDRARRWLSEQPSDSDTDRLLIADADATVFLGELRHPLREVRIPQLEQALVAAQRLGDRLAEGRFQNTLGNAYRDLGEMHQAIVCLQDSLSIMGEVGDRRGEGQALGNLGNAYHDLSEVRRAIELYEQYLTIAREVGDRRGEGVALGNLGSAYQDLGEVHRAIELYEQYLAIARQVGDWRGEGRALGNLGNAYRNLGEVRWAIELYEQHLAIARELSDRRREGIAIGNLGEAYADLSDPIQAIRCCNEALHLLRTVGDRPNESYVLNQSARAHLLQGEPDECLVQSAAALTLARDMYNRQVEGRALHTIAAAHAALGQPVEADANFTASLAVLEKIEHVPELNHTRWAYGQFLIQQGDRERGLALLDACVAYEQQIGHAKAAEHAAEVERLRQEGAP